MDPPNHPNTINDPADLPGSPMSAIIGFDCPCEVCNYYNRGLAIDSICPECGASIQQTVGGIRVVFRPIWWLRRFMWGSRIIVLGSMVFFFAAFLTAFSAFMQLLKANATPGPFHQIWLLVLWAAGPIILAAGWLVLTWSTPFAMSRRSGAESATRIIAMLICVTTVVGAGVLGLTELRPNGDPGLLGATLIGMPGLLFIFATPLLLIVGLVYTAAIALRIPSRSLTRNCFIMLAVIPLTIVAWIAIAPFYGSEVAGFGSSTAWYTQQPTAPDTWTAFAIAWSLALIATAGYAILFWRFASRFRGVLIDATARQDAPPP